MSNPKPLGNSNSVARACGNSYDNNEVAAGAFAMRPAEIPLKQISVDWVECAYDIPKNQNEDGAVRRLKKRLSQNGKRKVSKQPVAFLSVEEIHSIQIRGTGVKVLQDGSGCGAKACHCAMSGFTGTQIDLEIQEALAAFANQRSVKWIR